MDNARYGYGPNNDTDFIYIISSDSEISDNWEKPENDPENESLDIINPNNIKSIKNLTVTMTLDKPDDKKHVDTKPLLFENDDLNNDFNTIISKIQSSTVVSAKFNLNSEHNAPILRHIKSLFSLVPGLPFPVAILISMFIDSPYACDTCSAEFPNSNELSKHYTTIGSCPGPPTPALCPICVREVKFFLGHLVRAHNRNRCNAYTKKVILLENDGKVLDYKTPVKMRCGTSFCNIYGIPCGIYLCIKCQGKRQKSPAPKPKKKIKDEIEVKELPVVKPKKKNKDEIEDKNEIKTNYKKSKPKTTDIYDFFIPPKVRPLVLVRQRSFDDVDLEIMKSNKEMHRSHHKKRN